MRESLFTIFWSCEDLNEEKLDLSQKQFDICINKQLQFDDFGENMYLNLIFESKQIVMREWDNDKSISDNNDCR